MSWSTPSPVLLAQVSWSLRDILARQSPFGWVILLTLFVFLIGTIGILVERALYLRSAAADSRAFRTAFRRAERFADVKALTDQLSRSPLVGLFLAGYTELSYQLRGQARSGGVVQNLEAISRSLLRASTVEVAKLEKSTNFLATTASVTPFIGLLGTVYGIMSAFQDIGIRGSAGLTTVAPGISEALVATAAGLAAAIPAAIGYNYLIGRIKALASEMDDFSLEFVSIAERQFTS